MTDAKALEYLESFPNIDRLEISTLYPAAGEEALDFLNKVLVFNPYFRIPVDECLTHPFFSKIKKPEKEIDAIDKISLSFEKEGKLSISQLRLYFIEEIEFFKAARENDK